MDTNIDEIYAVFGELVAVQGISMKRLQHQVAELEERLMLAQRQIKKLEGTDDAPGQPSLNDHQGREVPVAEGDGQLSTAHLSELAQIPGNQGDAR